VCFTCGCFGVGGPLGGPAAGSMVTYPAIETPSMALGAQPAANMDLGERQ
jgi:hypothetical protein